MQDDILNARFADRPGRTRGKGGRTLAATFAAALLLGAAGTAWVSWHYGWLQVDSPLLPERGSQPAPAAPTPVAEPAIPPESAAKIAALEARLAELDQEAKVASGHASRAEGLLIAFAARRAIERGEPLGYLENQLRLRFGQSQPQSVDRVIRASTRPVTLDILSEQLALIEPQLAETVPNESTWDWLQREAAGLFIIRHQDSPSPAPARRLERARQYLAGGRVSAAMDEVSRMPGRDAARNWLAMAQSYVMTERALNLIENAAILQPAALPPAAVPPAAEPAPPAQPPVAPVPSPSASAPAEPAAPSEKNGPV